MQRLAQYRDKKAERLNKPLFKIIGDRTLIEIVNNLPKSKQELSLISGMSPLQIKRHGSEILKAIRLGNEDPVINRPARERTSNIVIKRIDLLKEWRKEKARKLGVESDVILPKDVLLSLCEVNKVNKKAVRKEMEDIPWRYKNYGDEIFQNLLDLENKRRDK
jgi:ribonuclease D